MKTDKQLQAILEEMKQFLVSPTDIYESPSLSDLEKKHLLNTYKDTLRMSDTPDIDPLDNIFNPILTWGTTESNKKFSPIEPHSFTILAGAQNSGKTAFSFDLALKNCSVGKVLYISLEMTSDQIFTRIALSYAGITKEEWRDKLTIPETKKTAYRRKKRELYGVENMFAMGFGDDDLPTIDNILEGIEREQPVFAVVDNLDLIARQHNMSELDHHQAISRTFMNFTNEHNIPVLLIHHLNKSGDPTSINSIRGSGKITDDADAVFLCKREMGTEEMTSEQRAQFTVIETKDRAFGSCGAHTYYFKSGTFVDNFDDYSKAFK